MPYDKQWMKFAHLACVKKRANKSQFLNVQTSRDWPSQAVSQGNNCSNYGRLKFDFRTL